MLGQRRRRWTNIETTLVQWLEFAGLVAFVSETQPQVGEHFNSITQGFKGKLNVLFVYRICCYGNLITTYYCRSQPFQHGDRLF